MFRSVAFQRITSALVLLAFTNMVTSPIAQAQRAHDANNAKGQSTEVRFSQLLADIKDVLQEDAKNHADLIQGKVNRIRNYHHALQALYADIEDGLADTERLLKTRAMPQAALDRHAAARDLYLVRKAEFERLAAKLGAPAGTPSAQQAALAELASFMDQYPTRKPHGRSDPNRLPFARPDSKVREPILDKEQLQARYFNPAQRKVLLPGPISGELQPAQSALSAPQAADDLAETEEVQITASIREQARALNHNPVAIYHWVRNNIMFVPSFGSIQGSELTLANRRGNAFDTAALLIALYRASGIPARYVYGTIEVPAARAMNWMGGAATPQAMQQLLGQGGIPNIALVAGGVVKALRMEHVWVQAYVDYSPSRGSINKKPGMWVPLDPSFKQYRFSRGMDLKNALPLDLGAMAEQSQSAAAINPAEGSVQNLGQDAVTERLNDYLVRIKAYIDSQKANATIADIFGTQSIIAETHSILPGTLPYKTVLAGDSFQSMPDELKWKFKTNIYASDGVSDSSTPLIEISQSTANLAGKRIGISFAPATQADQDIINRFLPAPHADGSPVQVSELPTSLPAYLLQLKACLTLDGKVVAQTASGYTLGSTLRQSNQFYNPSRGEWVGGDDNDILIGEHNAIGIDLQGTGVSQIKQQQAALAQIEAKLAQLRQSPADNALADELLKADIVGQLMQAGIGGYFASVDQSSAMLALMQDNVTAYRLPSYGRFGTMAHPRYFFGIVRSVSFHGVSLDVDYLSYQVAAKDGGTATVANYMQQAGLAASLAESSVPEAMFRNPELAGTDPAQPQGASAAKLLALASAQGQKIYRLSVANQAMHGSILASLQIGADVKRELANGLAAGKSVTVHDKDITIGNWTGCGYLIIDDVTGAGAFKISGGANGGVLDTVGNNSDALGFTFFVLGLIASVAAGPAVTLLVALAAFVIGCIAFMAAQLEAMEQAQCAAAYPCIQKVFLTVFAANFALALVGLLANPLAGLMLGLSGLIWGDNVAKSASRGCNVACRSQP